MTEPIIRPARLEDAKALHRHCYPEQCYEDVRDYLAWCLRQVEKGRILRLVAEIEGQAVGNVQLTVWGQDGEVGSLIVSEGFRRRGVAKRLVTAILEEAKQRELATLEIGAFQGDAAVIAFYQRLGFQRVQRSAAETKSGLSHPASSRSVVLLRKVL